MKSLITTLLLAITLSSTAFGDALYDGAVAYKKGDYKTAMRLWKPMAEKGDAQVQFFLGNMYEFGRGVPENSKQAVKWYHLAAQQGFAGAQFKLGHMYGHARYNNGRGVPEDYKQAVKWFRLAAEQGHAMAQNSLGIMYEHGDGVPEDKVLAYMWWNLSAANGDYSASENKGVITKNMTPSQIAEAQKLSRDCLKNNYKDC